MLDQHSIHVDANADIRCSVATGDQALIDIVDAHKVCTLHLDAAALDALRVAVRVAERRIARSAARGPRLDEMRAAAGRQAPASGQIPADAIVARERASGVHTAWGLR
jgi:hypothetical protein